VRATVQHRPSAPGASRVLARHLRKQCVQAIFLEKSQNHKIARMRSTQMSRRQLQIREILAEAGRLAVPVDAISADADLFAAGLDSLAIVNVLMRVEEQFDIELPDEMLQRKTFATITSIDNVVARLSSEATHTCT
jgi:acyl carrier protein